MSGTMDRVARGWARLRPRDRAPRWQLDPLELRRQQPRAALNVEHAKRIGEVIALERAANGDVYATAVTARVALLRNWDWYLSPEIDATTDYRDVVVRGIALTREPAQGRAALGRVDIRASASSACASRSSAE